MRACTHRGSGEISGSCVEIQSVSDDRILLDVGLPLESGAGDEVELPVLAGLNCSDPQPDHFGLVDAAAPEIAATVLGEPTPE